MIKHSFIISISAPPGGGKGTQGKLLRDTYNCYYLASGDIIREIKQLDTPLGREINKRYNQGIPQPDSVINKIFFNKIEKLFTKSDTKRFILDTFPLSLTQAVALKEFCQKNNLPNPYLIYLEASNSELIKRMSERLFCPNCGASYKKGSFEYKNKQCAVCHNKLVKREDDKIITIKNRLKEFKLRIIDILDYYKTENRLIVISGLGSIEEIHQNIVNKLTKHRVI